MIENELRLAKILQNKLAPYFQQIYANINLASNKFYPDWENWHGQPVPSAQPQIDLLLVDRSLWLLAVEVKYFRKRKGRNEICHPFYAGIDEALALLRFGFKIVSLWHFFDEELALEEVRKAYRSCELLMWNLDLPVNYQAFRMVRADTEVEFRRLYDGGTRETVELPSAYGKANPQYTNVDAQRIQDFLRSVLRIPQPR